MAILAQVLLVPLWQRGISALVSCCVFSGCLVGLCGFAVRKSSPHLSEHDGIHLLSLVYDVLDDISLESLMMPSSADSIFSRVASARPVVRTQLKKFVVIVTPRVVFV